MDAALDAEWYSLKGKKCLALKYYEVSVVLASKGGFVHDAAMINECFGEFLLHDYEDDDDTNKTKGACFRINEAIRLYREWGAFKKAKIDGQKNLIKVQMTKSLSIPHNIIGKFGACKVIMRPSIEGSGVIAGGSVRIVLEVAGIKNIIAKQLGSKNLLNNAFASICALKRLTTKSQVIKNRSLNL